jgi:hypothetical protein
MIKWKKLKRAAAVILRREGTVVSDKHGKRYEQIPESARAEIRQLLKEAAEAESLGRSN